MFVCVEDLQRSEWNSQIFPRLWKSSQLIQVFWCVCFIVGILCVWDQWCFVAVRKMSRSYPDPTFKIYCVSARLGEFLMESTPQQQFSARHKPLKSPAWQACRRAKSEPSRSLFEDCHLKDSFCCCPACKDRGQNRTTPVSPIPHVTARPAYLFDESCCLQAVFAISHLILELLPQCLKFVSLFLDVLLMCRVLLAQIPAPPHHICANGPVRVTFCFKSLAEEWEKHEHNSLTTS